MDRTVPETETAPETEMEVVTGFLRARLPSATPHLPQVATSQVIQCVQVEVGVQNSPFFSLQLLQREWVSQTPLMRRHLLHNSWSYRSVLSSWRVSHLVETQCENNILDSSSGNPQILAESWVQSLLRRCNSVL